MKNRANPIEIVLKDLPLDGREFTYSHESGELNSALKDLIQDNDYQVKFTLLPVGNAYSLKGEIKTDMDLQCSKCASDLKYPVKARMNELIVVEKPMSKGDQLVRANHAHELQDNGPDYLMLDNESFKVGDYIHEVIGLAEPIKPICPPDKAQACAEELKNIEREWLSVSEAGGPPIKANPFQILEKMKLKG